MFPKPPGKFVNFSSETELLVFLWENLYKSTAWIQCVFATELREPGCVRTEVQSATAGLFLLIVNCGEVVAWCLIRPKCISVVSPARVCFSLMSVSHSP